jgi:uncharacterized protein YdeI (BOF family)
MKSFVVAVCSLLIAVPALAQTSGEPTNSSSTQPTAGENSGESSQSNQRLVCRRVDVDTSNHMGSHRECHTAAEWRQIERDR